MDTTTVAADIKKEQDPSPAVDIEKQKDDLVEVIKQGDPFAICTAALGEQHTPRWERCVQSLKERYGASKSVLQQTTKADASWEVARDDLLPQVKQVHKFSLQKCNDDLILRLGTAMKHLSTKSAFGFSLQQQECSRDLKGAVTFKGISPYFWLDIEKDEVVGPMKVKVLDRGSWHVEKAREDEISICLVGRVVKGRYALRRGDNGRWEISGPESDRYEILCQSPDQRYSLGVAYPANKIDAHKDKIGEADLEMAAWSYMAKQGGRKVGLMHKDGTDGAGTAVESYIYRGPDWKVGDQVVKAGDWLLGVVWSEEAWGQIKKGAFTGYSIQGWALKS